MCVCVFVLTIVSYLTFIFHTTLSNRKVGTLLSKKKISERVEQAVVNLF